MRVLIVDDSAAFRRAARAVLEVGGYRVVGKPTALPLAFSQPTG